MVGTRRQGDDVQAFISLVTCILIPNRSFFFSQFFLIFHSCHSGSSVYLHITHRYPLLDRIRCFLVSSYIRARRFYKGTEGAGRNPSGVQEKGDLLRLHGQKVSKFLDGGVR